MKKLFCIGYFCLLSLWVLGQKTVLSEKESFSMNNDDFGVIGKIGSMSAVYRRHAGESEMLFYNEAFQKVKTIPLSWMNEELNAVSFSTDGEHISIFSQLKEQKKLNLFTAQVDQSGEVSNPQMVLSVSMSDFRERDGFTVVSSENRKKHMVFADIRASRNLALQLVVLDEHLQETKRIEQLFNDATLVISNEAAISNNGDAALIFSEKPGPRRTMNDVQLFTCTNMATEFVKAPLELNDKMLGDAHVAYDNAHELLYLFGFYFEHKGNNAKGIYQTSFETTTNRALTPFFTPIVLQITKGQTDLKDLKIRNYSLKKNGGLEIITESFFQQMRTITSVSPSLSGSMMNIPDNSRTVTEFNYEEIAIFNFKQDGSLLWSQTILKDQQTTDDNGVYSSYGIMENPKGKVYLFNDMNSRTTRLMGAYINAKGAITLKEMQTGEELESWDIMPRSAVQLNAREIVMPCVTKSYLCFLKIIF